MMPKSTAHPDRLSGVGKLAVFRRFQKIINVRSTPRAGARPREKARTATADRVELKREL